MTLLDFSVSSPDLYQNTSHRLDCTRSLSAFLYWTTMPATIAFTLISLISASLAIVITSISIVLLIIHLRRTRDVVLLLLTNTYVTIFLFSLLVIVINAKVIVADLYGFAGLNDSQLTTCQVEGFVIFVTFGLCYMSFLLQAFHRFTRVIYPKHRFLQVGHGSIWSSCSSLSDFETWALRRVNLFSFFKFFHRVMTHVPVPGLVTNTIWDWWIHQRGKSILERLCQTFEAIRWLLPQRKMLRMTLMRREY